MSIGKASVCAWLEDKCVDKCVGTNLCTTSQIVLYGAYEWI